MYNKRLLSKIKMGKSVKPNPYKKDIIVDPMGQWKYPGKNTRIPSSSITMKGVNYPVLGIANTGQKQMMQPGKEYNFPGADYVDEYPQMRKGGSNCPKGRQIYPEFKSYQCITEQEYEILKNEKSKYLEERNNRSKNILDLKNAQKWNDYKIEIDKFKKDYPNISYVCPGSDCPDDIFESKLSDAGYDTIYYPGNYPDDKEEEVKIDLIKPPKIDYNFSNLELQGELPQTELPQYTLEPYTDKRLRLVQEPGKTKWKKHHDRLGSGQKYKWTTGHSTKDLEFRRKEVTKPIASLVQRFTGYDPEYMEGYTDYEDNYIPGEIEKAEQEGRRINFKGASTLRDLKNQKKYNKEWDKLEQEQKLKDYYNNIYSNFKWSNLNYKSGGSSKQKIIFSPMEGGCPDGQYWTGSECKPIPKGTKIVYSQEELNKLNISKKEQQRLYNEYLLRERNHATIDAALRRKYGPIQTKPTFYKTFNSIPGSGFAPMMSIGTSSLIPNGLGPGIPSMKENMLAFKNYKKLLDQQTIKPIGYKGFPGGGHFYPVYEKPLNYILGYNREEEKIEKIPEEIELPPVPELEHGELPELQTNVYYPEPLPEAPQYELEPYRDERLRLSIEPGKTKSKKHHGRLFGHGQKYSWHTYKPSKDLELRRKEVVRPIPGLVQKLTGYDPKYFEGYENEEGDHIPGELEIANELGNKVEFRGAASLRDYINQQKYAKEYDEYQKKLDEWDERYEQLKKKQAEGSAFKKGGAKKKYTSDIINSTNYLFAEHPLFKKKKQSKKRIYNPKAKYYQNGGELPEDYQEFLKYSETAPENRRPDKNYVYGDPNDYDHYGMWEALGKPKDFQQALEMNPDWQPDPYDGYYHGFSVNPNTGVFLKSGKPGLKPGDTTWMEVNQHYLSPRSNQSNLVFDIDLQRFRYIPKEKNGGVLPKAQPGGLTRFINSAGKILKLPPPILHEANILPKILPVVSNISKDLKIGEGVKGLLADPRYRTGREDGFPVIEYDFPSASIKQLGDYKFEPYSEGWWAEHDMKTALEGPQWFPKKEDYFNQSEFNDLIAKQIEYNMARYSFDEMYPISDYDRIKAMLSGDFSRDELFSDLFPNVSIPNFRSKLLTPEQIAKLNNVGFENITFQDKGKLNKSNLINQIAGRDGYVTYLTDTSAYDTGLNHFYNRYKDYYKPLSFSETKNFLIEHGFEKSLLNDFNDPEFPPHMEQLDSWKMQKLKELEDEELKKFKKNISKLNRNFSKKSRLTGLDAYNKMLNESGSRNKYGGQLPKAQFGLGKDQSISISPYNLNTYVGASGNDIYNPGYGVIYNNPNLFKKLNVAGTPFELSISRPYNTDPESLRNKSLDYGNGISYDVYHDPGVQQGPVEEAIYNATAQYVNKDVQNINQYDINKYNAHKALNDISDKYTPGKPIDIAARLAFLGNAFNDQPLRAYATLEGGYNPEAGFWGGSDVGGFGVISNKSPRTYFSKGLTRKNDYAIIPKLGVLAPGFRQKTISNKIQDDEYRKLLEKDIAQGTTSAYKYYQNNMDTNESGPLGTFTFNIRPELKAQYKPFKKIPGILEGVIGANIDLLSGGKEVMNKITTNINPYARLSYSVPIQEQLDRLKNKARSIELPSKKHYEDYVEENENQPEVDNNLDINITSPEINVQGQGTSFGDCLRPGYYRPCAKCKCVKIPEKINPGGAAGQFMKDGGFIELELDDNEIEEYKKGGYIIEDISIPSLTRMQPGGLIKSLKPVIKGTENLKKIEKTLLNSTILNSHIPSIIKESVGEILMGDANRKAIAKGNEWLQNWINNPITQSKIQQDVFDVGFNPRLGTLHTKYVTPVYGDIILSPKDKYLSSLDLAKNFKPNVQEYPISSQVKDFLEGRPVMHNIKNLGMSYLHQSDPIQRSLYSTGYYLPNSTKIDPNYKPFRHFGSYVSRSPLISPYGKESIAIHEGTHDWITDYLLKATGQYDLVLNNLDPDVKAIYEKWIDPNEIKNLTEAEKDLGYYANPTEIHARIMQLRRHNNLTPFDIITDESAPAILEQINSGKVPFNGPLFAKTFGNDPKRLAKLMNDLYGIALPVGVAAGAGALLANPYADESPIGEYKTGGQYNLGDEIDEATMKQLKKLGYTFEKI